MAWLELHQSLFTHRKTMQAAETLDLPEVYVVAHLMALWTWALDNAPDGVLPASKRIIGKAAQWVGDPATFVNALFDAGFLDGNADGKTIIHDWHTYAGRLVEKREANAERMRRARAANVPDTSDANKNARAESVQRTCIARAGATVHNTTEQYKDKTPPTEGPPKTYVQSSNARRKDYDVVTVSLDLPDDNRANPQPRPKRIVFTKPSEPECLEYFILKSHPEYSERFWNYWESVGWKRAGKLMVDWQAAARQWIAEEKSRGTPSGTSSLALRSNKPGGMTIEDRKNETLAALRAG